MNNHHKQVFGPTINRIADVMAHTERYAFLGGSRLASDARVSASSVSRLINGKMNPSFLLVARLTDAIEATLGFHIDPRDLVSELGRFRTRHVCELVNCRGCLPDRAFDEFGDVKRAYDGVPKGGWVTSRFPLGYDLRSGGAE